MYQALVKKGKISFAEVPQPVISPKNVLIKVMYSCISPGTELAGIKNTGQSLFKKALEQPEKIKKFMTRISTQGLSRTLDLLQNKFDSYSAIGYSISGIVIAVGESVQDFKPGDRVSAAGAGWANHAEFVEVPRNLVVKIPDEVGFRDACTATLGSIALQGIRRADIKLGEYVAIVGLGTIGQLAVQLSKAAGAIVIGIDVVSHRITMAKNNGANFVINSGQENLIERIYQFTGGFGVDSVIFTAATNNPEVLSQAFQICKRKGKVVLVGVAGNEVRREDLYEKELDFLISCSYGPGRYDPKYEIEGIDYPYGYVRWTENRNLDAFLKLIADKRIKLDNLIDSVYPIVEVEKAYASLESERRPLMVLLEYNQDVQQGLCDEQNKVLFSPSIHKSDKTKVNIGIIGLGEFAVNFLLPNLKKFSEQYRIAAVASKSAHKLKTYGDKNNAGYCTSDYREIIHDPDIDAVMICTRHNLHAPIVLESLHAGKNVFVEKPLAIKPEELAQIQAFYTQHAESQESPLLQTGFNRRFSPYLKHINDAIQNRINPMIINYRMNAGHIPLDVWVHTEEGGGRNIGEACHIYDLFTFLTNSRAVSVNAESIDPKTSYFSHRDNFISTIKFADGSIASLTYSALGNSDYPKEQMEIMVDGKVFVLDNFQNLSIYGSKLPGLKTKFSEKGHSEELEAFSHAVKNGESWPIPLWQQVQAMEIAFAVEYILHNAYSSEIINPDISGELK